MSLAQKRIFNAIFLSSLKARVNSLRISFSFIVLDAQAMKNKSRQALRVDL
jgi:hypothetical protein